MATELDDEVAEPFDGAVEVGRALLLENPRCKCLGGPLSPPRLRSCLEVKRFGRALEEDEDVVIDSPESLP